MGPYYTLEPGYCAGIVSFFGRTQHRTTARAMAPAVARAFDREALPGLRQMPAFLLSIFQRRTERTRDLVELEEDLGGLSRTEIEDQSTALHNGIHRVQIRLGLYESRLADPAGEAGGDG